MAVIFALLTPLILMNLCLSSPTTGASSTAFSSSAQISTIIGQFSWALAKNGSVSFASVPGIASQLQNAAASLPTNNPLTGTNCMASSGSSTSANPCVYSHPTSKKLVVLFGDSHAQQWLNTVASIATARNWKLISLLRAGCGAAQSASNPDAAYQAGSANCSKWRIASLAWIKANHPYLILFSSDVNGLPWKTGKIQDQEASLASSLIADVGVAAKKHVVSIVDNVDANYAGFGSSGFPTNVCLSRNGVKSVYFKDAATATYQNDQVDCYRVYSNDVFDIPLATRNLVLAADKSAGISVIDPRPWMCSTVPETGLCPPVIDGTLVYRDQSHLTATFTARLVTVMGNLLPSS